MGVTILLLLLESINSAAEDHNSKWKLNKANWESFIHCETFKYRNA